MKSKEVHKVSKLRRYMTAPLRILIKARDLYILSMSQCSGNIGYGAVVGYPTAQVNPNLHNGFRSSSSKGEDYRELVRAASTRSLGSRTGLGITRSVSSSSSSAMPRSQSVSLGSIDEDKPCDFGEEDHFMVKRDVYPRSRSSGVRV